jgi:hypothetical protein
MDQTNITTLEQQWLDVNWFGFEPHLLGLAKEKSHPTEKSAKGVNS